MVSKEFDFIYLCLTVIGRSLTEVIDIFEQEAVQTLQHARSRELQKRLISKSCAYNYAADIEKALNHLKGFDNNPLLSLEKRETLKKLIASCPHEEASEKTTCASKTF